MASVSIITSQNIELEYDLASLGERMVASIIDLAIIAGYIIVLSMITSFSGGFFGDGFEWLYVFLFLPVTFYSLLGEIFFNGQTVGKKVMGIKIISLNGNPATFSQYLIRWLFRLVDFWMFGFVPATIVVAVTEKHQRIGDLVAGTTVVKTKPRTALQHTLFVPVADTAYMVTYPEVTNLTDNDMQLIKEVLLNARKSGNTMLLIQTMQKIELVLHIRNRHYDPQEFLEALLRDYNHLTAKM